METAVNRKAEMKAGRSPKFNMPIARAPRMTVKFNHERNVRSLAKKTLGSTRVGRAMRLPELMVQLDWFNKGGTLRRRNYLALSGGEVGLT
jgi:hypothetical protein